MTLGSHFPALGPSSSADQVLWVTLVRSLGALLRAVKISVPTGTSAPSALPFLVS